MTQSNKFGVCDLSLHEMMAILMDKNFALSRTEASAMARVDKDIIPTLGYRIHTANDYRKYCEELVC